MAYAVQIKLEELEKENAEMRKENTELRHIIAAHAGQIERNKNALCQLFGGLYNPTYQKRILKQHLIALLGAGADDTSEAEASEAEASDDEAGNSDEESDDDDYEGEEPLEDSCPTTRQGDAHETRLKESEERLRQLEAQIALVEKRQLEKYGFNM